MPSYEIRLNIPADRLQAYYRDGVQTVLAQASDGRRVQFPVASLRPFVSHGGVSGCFVLLTDDDNKLIEIRRKSF
ncbi:MAG TPA: DUF2835 family protein [Gammaproteobacteria bacterium]|nr:DUF2835 family protein [Gammaproteobacteria bacterium]